MVIHPPNLYLGFVGFAVRSAFPSARWPAGRLDSQWVRSIRRWTLIPWLFLTVGILLGGQWAYVELGWGGYWAWDPVENGLPAAVADRNRLPPLDHDPGEEGHVEGMEHVTRHPDVRAVDIRHVSDAQRCHFLRPCVCRIIAGRVFPHLLRDCTDDCRGVAGVAPSATTQRSSSGVRPVARKQLFVQQLVLCRHHVFSVVGDHVPDHFGGGPEASRSASQHRSSIRSTCLWASPCSCFPACVR